MSDQLSALIDHCTRNRLVCPQPRQWEHLWQVLTFNSPVHADGPTYDLLGDDIDADQGIKRRRGIQRPSPPFLHGAWVSSSDEQKHQRFMEHLAFADELGVLEDVNAFLRSLQKDQWEHAVSTVAEIIEEGNLGNWCVRWGCTTCASYQIRQALEHRAVTLGSLDLLIDEVADQPHFPDRNTYEWILRWLDQQTDRLDVRLYGSPAGQLFERMLHAKRASDALRNEHARRNSPEFVKAERARKKAERAEHHRIRQEAKSAINHRYRASLDQDLIEAYQATDYHVFADPPLVIRVGQPDSNLAQFLASRGVASAAYVTAWNPRGRACDNAANNAAQVRLIETVVADGYEWFAGEGRGTMGNWPPEPSILILGLSRSKAKRLGHKFRQNAIVWTDFDGEPELILLMPMSGEQVP